MKQLGADLKASMLCLLKKLNSNFQCYSNSSDIFIIAIVITMTIIIIKFTLNLTAGQYFFSLLYYYFVIKRNKGDIERLLIY